MTDKYSKEKTLVYPIQVTSMIRYISTVPTVFLIFTLVLFISCSSDPADEDSGTSNHLGQGWYAYNSGDYSQAILYFERALNADPELADAHNGVGWSNLSLALPFSLAQESFQNAVRYDPKNADAWIGLANVLYLRQKDNSDFNSAIRAIENALQGDKEYLYRHDYDAESDIYALKASCYFFLGENQKSLQEIEKVLKIEKDNTIAILLQQLING